MARGGKRKGAGRKVGSVTVRNREAAEQAVARGVSMLDIMVSNAEHFHKTAVDAEKTIAGLTVSEIEGQAVDISPADQFKLLLAKVTEAAGLRVLAQKCAEGAAPYIHSRLAPQEPAHGDQEFVPLAERLKSYARDDAIAASNGKVVEIPKKAGKHR